MTLKVWLNGYYTLKNIFKNNHRYTESCKINTQSLMNPSPVSSSGDILYSCSTISKPGNWPGYKTFNRQQTLFNFHQFLNAPVRLCVCVILCDFISCIDFYNSYHNQDTEVFKQHKETLSCYPFISHTYLHPWPLTTTNLFSISLSFQGCCTNGTIKYINFGLAFSI